MTEYRLSDFIQQFLGRGLLHADIGEEFLAGILQAGPKDVGHIVDDEEAVVVSLTYIYYNWWILLVMTLHVELLLLRELACVDGGRDVGTTIAEHRQGIDIDVIVDEDDGCLGLFDEADDMGVGIKDLPIVEDTLHRRQRKKKKKGHLIF